jgi:putative FmdB family regulatory protein
MPLYEYECETGGHRFEVIQKFSDPPVQKCPTCGGPVHKLISAPGFQFKGTGWYVTDYARKDHGGGSSKSEAAATSAEKSESTAKADSKGDKAPDKPSAAAGSGTSSAPSTKE